MGTQWGPNFEWYGDLMGTFTSTNGDPKSNFLKIYLNELIPWNTEKNCGKTPSQKVASFGAQVCAIFIVLSSQVIKWSTLIYSRCSGFSSAWNGDNGDLEKNWGPFGNPKIWQYKDTGWLFLTVPTQKFLSTRKNQSIRTVPVGTVLKCLSMVKVKIL